MAAEGGREEEEEKEEDEGEDFPPDFNEYMKSKLNFSRLKIINKYVEMRGWVFWNQEDDSLFRSYDRSDIRASRKVSPKIRHALHELILVPELCASLVQFWVPTKTSEGQTLLRSQDEPFALTYHFQDDTRDKICTYRMEMCEKYFYADAKCSEEQLGLPGRVFLHQFTEFNGDVCNYSEKEYPQLELALRCGVMGSLALPVFEHSSHSCLGVLEMLSFPEGGGLFYYDAEDVVRKLYNVFQGLGLLCGDGYKNFGMQWSDMGEANWDAYEELELLCGSVCKIHSLPLALTWLSCGLCSDVLHSRFNFVNGLRDGQKNGNLDDFRAASELCLLKKAQFTGRILAFPSLLYRSDVKQLSIAEYPLVPYARKCELSGCFTMCLQSCYPGDELCVVELFFPASNINNENLLTTLRLILNTMEEHLETYKLASGQGFGEELSVEIIDFENGQKSHSVRKIPTMDGINNLMFANSEAQSSNLPSLDSWQDGNVTTQLDSFHQSMDPPNKGQDFVTAEQNILVVPSSKGSKRKMQHEKAGVRIYVPLEEIHKVSHMTRDAAADMLKVSVATLKRVCREYGIPRWPPRNIEHLPVANKGHTPQLNSDLPSNEASRSVANSTIGFQDADKVTIRATYETIKIKFHLSLSSKLQDLQQEVATRLDLRAGTYYIEYKDKEDKEEELTLIACDADLQDCIQYFRYLETTSILLHLRRRLP